jgi:hypothetical protein
VDSLRYFWSEKAPDVMAHDLDEIIERYTADWHAAKVVVVGYSFGAGVVPFAVNASPQTKRRDRSVAPRLSRVPAHQIAAGSAVPGGDALRCFQVVEAASGMVQCFTARTRKVRLPRQGARHNRDRPHCRRASLRQRLQSARRRSSAARSGGWALRSHFLEQADEVVGVLFFHG